MMGFLENTCKLYADDGKIFVGNQKSDLQNDIHNAANSTYVQWHIISKNVKLCILAKVIYYNETMK